MQAVQRASLTAALVLSLPPDLSLPRRLHLLPGSLPPQRLPQGEASLTALLDPSLPTGVSLPGRLHLLPDSPLPLHLLQASFSFLHFALPKALTATATGALLHNQQACSNCLCKLHETCCAQICCHASCNSVHTVCELRSLDLQHCQHKKMLLLS